MDDRELLRRFEDLTLPFEQWTHRAHVKVAFLYLRALPFEEALARMRRGVMAYNAANGVKEGPQSGYNETTTHAFMRLIDAMMRAYGEHFPAPDADAFCDAHPQLMSKHVLRFFYSPARRMHPESRQRFVEPDLAPLPAIADGSPSRRQRTSAGGASREALERPGFADPDTGPVEMRTK